MGERSLVSEERKSVKMKALGRSNLPLWCSERKAIATYLLLRIMIKETESKPWEHLG